MAGKGAPPGNQYAQKGVKPFDSAVHIRCYKEQKKAWLLKAKAENKTLTDWLKQTADSAASK